VFSRASAETLEAMTKVLKQEVEAAKVSVRHARKLAMDATRSIVSEDERYVAEKKVTCLGC
jgi:ribosome recycling factor